MSAFNAGDLDALVALYEPDAVFAYSGGTVTGHSAIREAYRSILEVPGAMQLETVAAFESPDGIALTHGRWSRAGATGVSAEVSRRQPDGRWLFILDNSDTPQR